MLKLNTAATVARKDNLPLLPILLNKKIVCGPNCNNINSVLMLLVKEN